MKINIGSGFKRIDGFINVDNFQGCKPDFLCDIEKDRLPFEDNSVSYVTAHHILEHTHDIFHVMRELYRVCKDGAVLDIRVPHPRHDTFLIDPTHVRPIYPHTMSMFGKKHNLKDIEAGGCETPIALIHDVDFEMTKFDFNLDPFYVKVFQEFENHECDFIARSQNNVVMEIQMFMKVVK